MAKEKFDRSKTHVNIGTELFHILLLYLTDHITFT